MGDGVSLSLLLERGSVFLTRENRTSFRDCTGLARFVQHVFELETNVCKDDYPG